ncbi:PEP-CTERM sorting domain-containing protein [Colwelliaceae bacterium MEBiC 14330]
MLHKLVLRVLLSISIAFSAIGAANATLISQDILLNSDFDAVDEYEVIGNVTISLDTMDEWGYVENTWESFTFYGYDVDTFDINWNIFSAIVDVNNVEAGIESLDFDVTIFSTLSFAGVIDTFNPAGSYSYSLFDNADGSLYNAGTLAFGNTTIVPTPATLVLFLTAVIGLAARRKNS